MGQEFGTIEAGKPFSMTTGIAKTVMDRFTWARNLRFLQQEKWLSAKMAFDGIDYYGADEDANKSGIYLNFTQMKTMSAYSQIMATMMGPDGFPWYIKPTPDPDLIKLGITNTEEAERMPNISDTIRERVALSNMACDGMRVRIKDDLIETRWEEKFSMAVLDLVILGTMIVKGPFGAPPKPKRWELREQEEEKTVIDTIREQFGIKKPKKVGYKLVSPDEDPRPELEIVSPFEFYPDPSAFTIEDCMWAVHRHVMNKAQLLDLARVEGFDAEEIDKVIEAYPKGNWTAETWESRVYALNQRQTPLARGDRYVVLEYWGYMSSEELIKAGVELPNLEKDKHKQHMCCVWTVGNYAIKVAVSTLEKASIPFMVCPYERVLYNIWGRGIPEKMRDPQDIVNAAARAMVDNMGIAAGPQVVYDTSRMVNGFKFEGIKPWGVWPLKSMEGVTNPPVTFVSTPSILNELKVLQDNFKLFIQEVTSMPDMAGGFAGSSTGQHNRTASGMSMLFNAANTYIKGVVFNIDNNITKPMIRKLYDWNMQFSSDIYIKGDFTIEAGGVQSIINEESRQSNMQELANIMQDPDYKPYINKEAILKQWIRSHGFNGSDIINSDSEAQAIVQAQMEAAAKQAQKTNLPKVRAEMPRGDALLEILKSTPTDSAAFPSILEEVVLSQNSMTPSMKEAIDTMKIKAMSNALMEVHANSEKVPELAPEMQTKSAPTAEDLVKQVDPNQILSQAFGDQQAPASEVQQAQAGRPKENE